MNKKIHYKKEIIPKLSIIIPCYNEEKDIQKCLQSLEEQSFNDFEIIIVDDGSTDRTKEIVRKIKEVKLIEGKHKGPGVSRNLGAKMAKGEILIFVDADMNFDKNYIKYLIDPIVDIEKDEIIGTTHELEIVENINNIWSRCWGKIRVSKENSKDVKIFRAIKKCKFFELGCFEPKYGYADDQTFWFKYKIKPLVAKNTICYHKNPENLKEVYKQSRWIGASINNIFLELPIIKYFFPILLLILFPIIIPFLSIKKIIVLKDYKILHWMFIFIIYRYLGTIAGIFNRIYFNKNFR